GGKRADMEKKSDMYRRGDETRRRVLGDDYVDQTRRASAGFGNALQDLVTEYGWGAVWSRPRLPPKTRSLSAVGVRAALDRPAELKMHLLGARRNGCSIEEIEEVLLHTMIYCGGPAALAATKVAREVLAPPT